MTLPAIQSLWIGSSLSIVEQLCIKSFLDNGHPFHLYTYSQIENIPEGTTVLNANEIIPESEIFTLQTGWGKGSYTAFANMFRYKLLLDRGGWWFDTDIICIKPLTIEQTFVIGSSWENKWGQQANNCVLRTEPGNSLMEEMYYRAHKADKATIKFGETGVHLLQTMVKEKQLDGVLAPYYFFNPISWHNIGYYLLSQKGSIKNQLKENLRPILKPETMKGKKIHTDSFTVHFWNEVWRKNGYDKNAIYPSNSLFEKLKRKHGF